MSNQPTYKNEEYLLQIIDLLEQILEALNTNDESTNEESAE